ncbi:MAG: hypothetical protein DMG01_28345 [Acidobacteria bacterium]|nr:MAG: hypothetical protein DMG01_28345 [Acidobacteriota bacterium]
MPPSNTDPKRRDVTNVCRQRLHPGRPKNMQAICEKSMNDGACRRTTSEEKTRFKAIARGALRCCGSGQSDRGQNREPSND